MKFIDPGTLSKDPEERAQKVFEKLDSQMSGGVTYKELVPSSGDTIDKVADSLLRFEIPLAYFKEVRVEGQRKNDSTKSSLRFVMNPKMEDSKEWAKLKLAMNPDWERRPGFESLSVVMTNHHFELWKQVIKESGMAQVQEFIRFYDGATEEHPKIGGVYMRDGRGTQRWVDGKVYEGQWKCHQYYGQGRLYASLQDQQLKITPLYDGEWSQGKKHGEGILQWEQEVSSGQHNKGVG